MAAARTALGLRRFDVREEVAMHFGGAEFLIVFLVLGFLCIPIVIGFLFALTVRMLLEACAPESRTIQPNSVWWLLVPLVNIVFQFVVVLRVATTLANEHLRRQRQGLPETGKEVGLAACIAGVASLIPGVGPIAGVVCLGCWIYYWVLLRRITNQLHAAAPVAAPPPPHS
jgi:hypothetical protein